MYQTRESWLAALMQELAPLLEEVQPGSTQGIENWRVSCGFPGGGSARKRIGECWSSSLSHDGRIEMFISPVLGDAISVDHVLLHEMIHAADGVKSGHRGPFAKMAKALGLVGKMTSTTPGPALRERLNSLTEKLGPYPHSALSLSGRKKQATRLVKCTCPECGYIIRTTDKWLDQSLPMCQNGHDSVEFEVTP
jgi:hypothetical protein